MLFFPVSELAGRKKASKVWVSWQSSLPKEKKQLFFPGCFFFPQNFLKSS